MNNPSDLEILAYTVAEACRVSGVGKTKLYELIQVGEIEARKLGCRTLVSASSLRAFLGSLPPVSKYAKVSGIRCAGNGRGQSLQSLGLGRDKDDGR
jgi:excisionase family DNA binding protein